MVGDDIESDIGGALHAGLQAILVRTGKYREERVARVRQVARRHPGRGHGQAGIAWRLAGPPTGNRARRRVCVLRGRPSSGTEAGRLASGRAGFGNVGSWAAQLIAELGCKLVGVSDLSGAIQGEAGIDPNSLLLHLADGGKLVDFPAGADGAEVITPEELIALDCEVRIPAALGGAIDSANADSVRARMIVEGANTPPRPARTRSSTATGVLVIPDVLANAGGVIVSYFEWAQNPSRFSWDEREVNDRLAHRMQLAYRQVEERARAGRVSLRVAAYELGIERVVEAGRLRGRRGYVQ